MLSAFNTLEQSAVNSYTASDYYGSWSRYRWMHTHRLLSWEWMVDDEIKTTENLIRKVVCRVLCNKSWIHYLFLHSPFTIRLCIWWRFFMLKWFRFFSENLATRFKKPIVSTVLSVRISLPIIFVSFTPIDLSRMRICFEN